MPTRSSSPSASDLHQLALMAGTVSEASVPFPAEAGCVLIRMIHSSSSFESNLPKFRALQRRPSSLTVWARAARPG